MEILQLPLDAYTLSMRYLPVEPVEIQYLNTMTQSQMHLQLLEVLYCVCSYLFSYPKYVLNDEHKVDTAKPSLCKN